MIYGNNFNKARKQFKKEFIELIPDYITQLSSFQCITFPSNRARIKFVSLYFFAYGQSEIQI